MMKRALMGLLSVFLLIGCKTANREVTYMPKESALAHTVFFTLNEASPAGKEKLVRDCHTYLKNHPGVTFFAVGTLAEDLDRPVNARDFAVSLQVVFQNRKAHDDYQKAPDHLEFIRRNQANWKQVRVFDSIVR